MTRKKLTTVIPRGADSDEGPSERELALVESCERRANWRRGRYTSKFQFDGYLVTAFKEPLDFLLGDDGPSAWGWDIERGGIKLKQSEGLWPTSVQAEGEAVGELIMIIRGVDT
jgi:hypothetical protein